ncbi:MAG: hypothetical protein ACXADU_06575 [Promethearchaeota archaeon]
MFSDILFILGFMVCSILISYLSIKFLPPPLSTIIKGIAIVGIVIHELCHLFLCVISHTPTGKVSLLRKLKDENEKTFKFYGEVQVIENKTSFLQTFLVSFAPLYISFWLFFYFLNLLIYHQVSPLILFFSIFMMITLLFSAGPSVADLANIPKAFLKDSDHSLYQLLLISFSLLSTWFVSIVYDFQYPEGILVYLVIAGFYLIFKFSFRFFNNFSYWIYSKFRPNPFMSSLKLRRILHKRRKLGEYKY